MPKSKLGVYVISLSDIDLLGYVSASLPRIVLSMDHNPEVWREVKRISPNTFILGRHYLDDGEQLYFDQPELRAQQFFERLRADAERMRGIYDAWMGYNETVIKDAPEARRLSRFYARWGDLMREQGLRSAAYSFSTGNPAAGFPDPNGNGDEPNLWQYLDEGLCHCDYLSLHEYSAPNLHNLEGYLCLRYRRVYELLPAAAIKPLLLSECGIDGGVLGSATAQRGWSFFTSEEGYLSELQWYDEELQKDDYVFGATIFSMNAWGIGDSFAIKDALKIRDYIGAGGSPPPIFPPPLSLEDTILAEAESVPWMPVNNQAALWRFAKAQGLQDQQTDELHVTYDGTEYIVQVFNLGVVYCRVGDWGNIKVIRK